VAGASKFRRVGFTNVRLPTTFSLASRKRTWVKERVNTQYVAARRCVVGRGEVARQRGGWSSAPIGWHLVTILRAFVRNGSSGGRAVGGEILRANFSSELNLAWRVC